MNSTIIYSIPSEMMKKLLFLIISLFFLKTYAFGQACIPDPQYTNTNTQRGVHPDTTTNLAPAYVGATYSQIITIVVPPDTALFGMKIKWDSTVLVSVIGLPAGFTYACYNSSPKPHLCSWKGNSIGCVVIESTAISSDIGIYSLVFNTNNYVGGSVTAKPYPARGYKIIVNASNSIHENPNVHILQQNNPNPFNDISEILFSAKDNGVAHFKIYNVLGIAIQEFDISAKRGINKLTIDAKDFNSGIYFYSLDQGADLVTRKMIVEK